MGRRREVSIIFYRPVTRSDLKQERSFFRGSVSTFFLQLVVAQFLGVHQRANGSNRISMQSLGSSPFLFQVDNMWTIVANIGGE